MTDQANATEDFTITELNQVPANQRTLLAKLASEHCSYKHLADTFNIPVGTVKSRISRARRKIARLRGREAA